MKSKKIVIFNFISEKLMKNSKIRVFLQTLNSAKNTNS